MQMLPCLEAQAPSVGEATTGILSPENDLPESDMWVWEPWS